jgi:hypothetical protein
VAGAVLGQTTQPLHKGTSDIFFTQRSALSAIETQHARYGIPAAAEEAYDISKERFSVVVPDSYDPESMEWGVLVWCNAGKGAPPPKDWEPSLATKKLIAIGAYNVGNDRAVGIRVGLAIDAAVGIRQRYPNLAEHRIYVSGVSGGAKVASMAAMAYPDVFDGAICCAGVNWYKDTPLPNEPGKAWPATFRRPPPPTFNDAREHVGFVLISGSNDGNYLPVKTMYEKGFLGDDFKHATFFDVPELGHRTPPAQWFEQAIDYLDAIEKKREKKVASSAGARVAAATLPAAKPAPAPAAPPTSEPAAVAAPGAAQLLSLAKNYRAARRPDKAIAKLEQILKEYPDSEEAKVARTMLQQIKSTGS